MAHARTPYAASLTLCLLAVAPSASAQASLRMKVDRYVRAEMERRHIPGVVLTVLRDHRVILTAHYGMADVSLKTPVSARTSFEIASMSKQFTDAAVLLLAEQGRLAVTDSLSRHFPDLPPSWQPITVQQLMNHTAGLRDDWDEDDQFFTSKTTSAEFFDALKASPLKFVPGTDWSYSAGPFVLGLLIERVSGHSYAEFMRESIFTPLGMASTTVNHGDWHAPNRASGYIERDGVIQEGIRLSAAAHGRADVGLRTTAQDLARWDAALHSGSFLTPASQTLMFTPGRLTNGEVIAHGLGWFVTPYRGHTEVAHGGRFRTGFSSVIAWYPDDGLTIIVLTNQFKARASEMARTIASFYNRDYLPIPMMTPRPAHASPRDQVVTRVLNALKRGDTPAELLPGVGRLGGWSRAELRKEVAQASAPTFIDCQNLAGRHAKAFDAPIVANCFYRTGGDRVRYWTVSFTQSERVAYIELEQ
ncbi:MAG: serine hydrolase domain-containing protein [Gemmatimonadaceae bacterium]